VKFSIIIPLKKNNLNLEKNVNVINKISKSDKKNKYEIIVILNNRDYLLEKKYKNVNFLISGPVGPAKKRDIGAKLSKGDYLVFFDDDSFPKKNYFKVLSKTIKKNNYKVFCGPGISPNNQTLAERLSGIFYESNLSGGSKIRYNSIGKQKEVEDWPSVNFVIKKNFFFKIGMFNTHYYPGEDTILCDKITKINNEKILYVPQLVVYHRRRSNLLSHLKQIYGYSTHRGFFLKKYGKSSKKTIYAIPSIFFISLIASTFLMHLNSYLKIYFFLLLNSYFIFLLVFFIETLFKLKSLYSIFVFPYVLLSHFVYGYGYLIGLIKKDLKNKKYLKKFS
jgi:GT2 family glycosyltransferase